MTGRVVGVPAARQSHQTEGGGSIPTTTLFDKHAWEVRPCSFELARQMVRKYHYARGGSNTAVYTHGLFPRGAVWDADCAGVAWWIPPTKGAALKSYPANWQGVLALSRLVIVPDVPKNACSFLIRHAMRFIDRKAWPCLITFADEWRGHEGTIYKAAGWVESGWTKPEPTFTKNGRMLSRKAGPKTRTRQQMLDLGCEYVGSFRKRRFVHKV